MPLQAKERSYFLREVPQVCRVLAPAACRMHLMGLCIAGNGGWRQAAILVHAHMQIVAETNSVGSDLCGMV